MQTVGLQEADWDRFSAVVEEVQRWGGFEFGAKVFSKTESEDRPPYPLGYGGFLNRVNMNYLEFLQAKMPLAKFDGYDTDPAEINPIMRKIPRQEEGATKWLKNTN